MSYLYQESGDFVKDVLHPDESSCAGHSRNQHARLENHLHKELSPSRGVYNLHESRAGRELSFVRGLFWCVYSERGPGLLTMSSAAGTSSPVRVRRASKLLRCVRPTRYA